MKCDEIGATTVSTKWWWIRWIYSRGAFSLVALFLSANCTYRRSAFDDTKTIHSFVYSTLPSIIAFQKNHKRNFFYTPIIFLINFQFNFNANKARSQVVNGRRLQRLCIYSFCSKQTLCVWWKCMLLLFFSFSFLFALFTLRDAFCLCHESTDPELLRHQEY